MERQRWKLRDGQIAGTASTPPSISRSLHNSQQQSAANNSTPPVSPQTPQRLVRLKRSSGFRMNAPSNADLVQAIQAARENKVLKTLEWNGLFPDAMPHVLVGRLEHHEWDVTICLVNQQQQLWNDSIWNPHSCCNLCMVAVTCGLCWLCQTAYKHRVGTAQIRICGFVCLCDQY